MNDDVAADVDASGGELYYGMSFVTMMCHPRVLWGHHSWDIDVPPPRPPPKTRLSYPIGWTQYLSMDGLDDGVQFFIPKDSPQMIGLHAAD
jgi:hypothetical protein